MTTDQLIARAERAVSRSTRLLGWPLDQTQEQILAASYLLFAADQRKEELHATCMNTTKCEGCFRATVFIQLCEEGFRELSTLVAIGEREAR